MYGIAYTCPHAAKRLIWCEVGSVRKFGHGSVPISRARMIFSTLLVTLVSLATLTEPVSASLRITADHHSFGGVNYPQLQFFAPEHRDNTIKEIIKSGARVIRLFSM